MNKKIYFINWLVIFIAGFITCLILANKHTDIIKAIFIVIFISCGVFYFGIIIEELSGLENKLKKNKK